MLAKGRLITAEDLSKLSGIGLEAVHVAILADDDVPENEAARRLGQVIGRGAVKISKASTGRVNVVSEADGVLAVDVDGLLAFNDIDGITLALSPNHTVVQPGKICGTLKIIPYAVSEQAVEQAEAIAQAHNGLVTLHPYSRKQALLLTTGRETVRQKTIDAFLPPLRQRLADYGMSLDHSQHSPDTEADTASALQTALASQPDLILIAGDTSIMDADDITPRAIKQIGGQVIHHGVPVEPGNLLLLADYQGTPIVGVPGCARSLKSNVIDLVLPRLAAGQQLTRRDMILLGHGGYLK